MKNNNSGPYDPKDPENLDSFNELNYLYDLEDVELPLDREERLAQDRFVTITGFKHYHGLEPFAIGSLVCCRKEPYNPHDQEAIRCCLPLLGTVGYLANSPQTKAGGTLSAGRLYDRVESVFYVRVLFTTSTKVICKVETGDRRELAREIKAWILAIIGSELDEYED